MSKSPNKKPGKLKSKLAAFEKDGNGDDIDAMLSPEHVPKKKIGKLDGSGLPFASPSATKLKIDKETILAQRKGTVEEIVTKFNEQESLNEEYLKKLLEDKALRKERCRARKRKKKKTSNKKSSSSSKSSDESGKSKKKKKTSSNKKKKKKKKKKTSESGKKDKDVTTSTASVWKNRKATSSIEVDPETYEAPDHLKADGGKVDDDTRQLIEDVMDNTDAGNTLFLGDPTKKDNMTNREQFVNAFEPIEFNPGDVVVEEKDNDHFYVVQEGAVDIQVNGVTVRTADKGDTFGELNLLYNRRPDEQAVMVASTRTTDPTKLLRLNQKDYREIMQVQTKQEELEKRELLRRIPFLKKLLFAEEEKNNEIIVRLCSLMIPELLEIKDNDFLEEEDAAETLYVVKDGNVQLTSVTGDTFMLAPGDYIGKKPMMGTGKEPTVQKLEPYLDDAIVYSIKREDVDRVLGKNFFSRHQSRMQDRAKLEKFECIANAQLDNKTMEIMADSVVDATYDTGKKVFEQGEKVEPCLYMVREGSVILSTNDGSFHQEVGPGGYFGVEQLLVPGQDGNNKGKLEKVLLPAEWNVTVSDKMPCVCGVLDLSECQAILDNKGEKPAKEDIVDTQTPDMKKREVVRRSFREKPFNLDDLEMETVLGDGEFGEVWLVSADVYGKKEKFALKIQDKREADMDALKREIDATSAFNHPFIVNLVTSYETEDSMYMLLGLVSGGELWDVIHKEDGEGNWISGISEAHAKFYSLLIADTLAYIHSKQYVFRDLKPENVMIGKDGYPVLVDFGFAKYVTDKTYTCCGTPNYVAPEIIWNTGHDRAVDLWALGILTYEMVTGEHPFFADEMDQMALYNGISEGDYYPLPDSCSDDLAWLIDGLLTKEPSQRLGMLAEKEKDILNHSWFTELNLEKLRIKGEKAPYIPPSK